VRGARALPHFPRVGPDEPEAPRRVPRAVVEPLDPQRSLHLDRHEEEIDNAARAIGTEHANVRDAVTLGDVEALLAIIEEQGDELPLALAAQVGLVLALEAEHSGPAVTFLQRQSLHAPDDFWINMALGQAALKQTNFALSARHCTAAVTLRPTQSSAWSLLSTALTRAGDAEGAIGARRKAIEINADHARARGNLDADRSD